MKRSKLATVRAEKGKSIIDCPNDYVVIDIETTGLSPQYDSIIEVSAVKVVNNAVVDRFESLLKPDIDGEQYVDAFIESLTGITNEMLAEADNTKDVLQKYSDFISDFTIVGHCVSFDINFLYDNFNRYLDHPLTNDFVDTIRIYRRLAPQNEHHRLEELCVDYKIENKQAHRAYSDCEATAVGYVKLCNAVKDKYGSFDEFIKSLKKSKNPKNIIGDPEKIDKNSPLYEKHCTITGKLERFKRADAWQIIADLGGISDKSVTKETNFLVLGNNDYCRLIKDGKSSKHKRAEQLKLDGQDIEILPETVFYDMIGDDY